MSIQYFNVNALLSYVVDAWQNQLQTESDPANGKWFKNGPNNGSGLIGGLTDTLASDLMFSQDRSQMHLNQQKEIAASTTIDNREGLLNDAPVTQTLQWTITNSSSASHTSSNSVKTGISEKISSEFTIKAIDIKSETTVSFEYQYSWSDTSATTSTDTKTFTCSVPLKVPQGKVYKLIVTVDTNTIKIPYSAQVILSGNSEANFGNSVNGKPNWSADAGSVCSWIKKYGCAQNDTLTFDVDPDDPSQGVASMKGVLTAKQSVNFQVYALDVTDTMNSDPSTTASTQDIISGQTPKGLISIPQPRIVQN